MNYREITIDDIEILAKLYIETFNASPWNDGWTEETTKKRLHQMICVEDFYGLCAFEENQLCGMILGSREQFYDGVVFNLKEFCVRNSLRGQGVGSRILDEFERRLKIQGIDRITLLTARGNMTEGFYGKRGMDVCKDMVMMSKKLC